MFSIFPLLFKPFTVKLLEFEILPLFVKPLLTVKLPLLFKLPLFVKSFVVIMFELLSTVPLLVILSVVTVLLFLKVAPSAIFTLSCVTEVLLVVSPIIFVVPSPEIVFVIFPPVKDKVPSLSMPVKDLILSALPSNSPPLKMLISF